MQARVQIPRFRVLLGINPSGKNEIYYVKSPGEDSFSFSIVAGCKVQDAGCRMHGKKFKIQLIYFGKVLPCNLHHVSCTKKYEQL